MIWILILIVLFIILTLFLKKNKKERSRNIKTNLSLKKIENSIRNHLNREATVDEKIKILKTVDLYYKKYNFYPHDNDLIRIISKCREKSLLDFKNKKRKKL